MANILVTGGAGYVGSHCCLALAQAGHDIVVYDDLSNGHRAFARFGAFEAGDIRDGERLRSVIAKHQPDAAMHFAALIEVGASVTDPAEFYDVNVRGALTLLAALREAGVARFVFSSTCATYGAPQRLPLDETHPQWPLNPYGWTKLAVERALLDFDAAYGLKSAILRYFNAAGAAPEHELGERHAPETHAIPLALFALLGRGRDFTMFGDDYDTRDGTCVRDYVHVLDLADAHVRALDRLLAGGASETFNLGTGSGVSVRELLDAIAQVAGRRAPVRIAARRAGDAPALVADASKAADMLGWRPRRSLEAIVESALAWHAEVEPRLFPARAVATG